MREWRKIPGVPGYSVSSCGEVRSDKSNGLILSKILSGRYYYFSPSIDGNQRPMAVHSAVAMAFLGHNQESGLVIDHIDGNSLNNNVKNLDIVTQRENVTRSFLRSKTTSKYTGVYLHKKTGKWKAGIRINGKIKHLGYFNKEEDAHKAYQTELNNIKK